MPSPDHFLRVDESQGSDDAEIIPTTPGSLINLADNFIDRKGVGNGTINFLDNDPLINGERKYISQN